MYWTLRTASLKRVLPYSAALLLLAALLILISGFAPLRMLAGPTELRDVTLDSPAGTYVRADAVKVFDAFAELGNGKRVKAVDCIIACGDGRVMALCLPASMIDKAEEQMQATYSWLVSDGVEPRYGFEVRGELVPLKGEELEAYFTWLDRNADRLKLAGSAQGKDYADYALPFVLRVNMLGGVETWIMRVVTVIVVLLFAAALALILMACLGLFQLSCRLYVRRHKKALKLRSVQSDFEMAEKVGDARVGETFTWYFSGPATVCLRNSNIIWVYSQKRGSGANVVIYKTSGSCHELHFRSGRKAERFVDALKAVQGDAVYGYSPEIRAQFKEWLTRRMLRKGAAK